MQITNVRQQHKLLRHTELVHINRVRQPKGQRHWTKAGVVRDF